MSLSITRQILPLVSFNCYCLSGCVVASKRIMTWTSTIHDEPEKMAKVGTFHKFSHLLSPNTYHGSQMKVSPVCLTGIICELGKSSCDSATLVDLLKNGMTIAKINCSTISPDYFASTIDELHTAIMKVGGMSDVCLPCAVAVETRGPDIRTGPLYPELLEEVELKKGTLVNVVFTESFNDKFSSKHIIFMNRPKLSRMLQENSLIHIGDESIVLSVREHDVPDMIECIVVKKGMLGSWMPVLIPGITVDSTMRDAEDIVWGLRHGMDILLASLTESAQDIQRINKLLISKGNHIKVFAKIENLQGWKNFDSILRAADGIFIARDALSMSIQLQKMFSAQKNMVFCCNKMGKPVIIGGQVMSSMTHTTEPSRSEITDIFTAVLDGADCIELSPETVYGKYPKEAVHTLSTICREAEAAIQFNQISLSLIDEVPGPLEGDHTAVISAVKAAIVNKARSIICITNTGKTAFLLSKYSPPCPVVAVTSSDPVAKALLLYRAILPVVYKVSSGEDWMLHFDSYLRHGVKYAVKSNLVKLGDSIIVISRWKKAPGFTDSVRIVVECVDRYIES